MSGCKDTIKVSDRRVISFWATGGTPPYSDSLSGNPNFVTLEAVDDSGAKGHIIVNPTSCDQAGTYHVTLAVSELTGTARSGQMDFALTVSACSG